MPTIGYWDCYQHSPAVHARIRATLIAKGLKPGHGKCKAAPDCN
jgi:hypothetical protein